MKVDVLASSHATADESVLSGLFHLPSGVNIAIDNSLEETISLPTKVTGSTRSLWLDETSERNLLAWCRAVTDGYPGVEIKNFANSWRDGRAFLAILHRYKPTFFDYSSAARLPPQEALEFAFTIAEEKYGITRLIYSEDMLREGAVDERSVIVYLSSIYDTLALGPRDLVTGERKKYPIPPLPTSAADIADLGSKLFLPALNGDRALGEELHTVWKEYRTLAAELIQWLRATCDRLANRHFPADLEGMQQLVLTELKRHRREELPIKERQRQQLVRLYADLQTAIDKGFITIDPFMKIENVHRLWKEYELALQKRELAATAETNRLERLQRAGDNVDRECAQLQAQETALEKRMQELNVNLPSTHMLDVDGELQRWASQLEAIEAGVNRLFGEVQFLRSGRYVRTEQVYRRVCTVHQQFLELQRRYRRQVAALAPVTQKKTAVPLGSSLSESMFSTTASSSGRETLRTTIKQLVEGNKNFAKISSEDEKFFTALLDDLDRQYDALKGTSNRRLRLANSLLSFVERASNLLAWLEEKESVEIFRDWTPAHQLQSAEIYAYFQSYLTALDSHWAWLLQLTHCLETRLDRSVRFQQFFSESNEAEIFLQSQLKQLEVVRNSASQFSSLEQIQKLMDEIAEMGEAIREHGYLVDRLVGLSEEVVSVMPGSRPQSVPEQLVALCSFGNADDNAPCGMELNTAQSPNLHDSPLLTSAAWPIGIKFFEKGDKMTMTGFKSKTTLGLRTSSGEDFEAPAICFLPVRPCSEAIERAQNIVAEFQRVLVTWADTELLVNGILLRVAMRALHDEFSALSPSEQRMRMQAINSDAQRHLVAMRLARRPNADVEGFRKETELFQAWYSQIVGSASGQNNDGNEGTPTDGQLSEDLQHLQKTLDRLADQLQQLMSQALPNQITTLDRTLKTHKEWMKTTQQVRARLQMMAKSRTPTASESVAISALTTVAETLINAGGAAGSRLADVDAILVRVDNLQHALAESELRLFRVLARMHSPASPRVSSVSCDQSTSSSQSEVDSVSVQSLHADLKDITMSIHGLLKTLEQFPHQLTNLSIHQVSTSPSNVPSKPTQDFFYRLPPPNTALLEELVTKVNNRWASIVQQLDSSIHLLMDTFDQFKTCLKTRKELTSWMQEALDLLDSVERTRRLSTAGCPQVLSAQLRKLEQVSTEMDHYEGLLTNLKTTYANLRQSLEDSARQTDRYRLSLADLPSASPDVRNICLVGPPGAGIADLVAFDTSVYNIDTKFTSLKDRLAAHIQVSLTPSKRPIIHDELVTPLNNATAGALNNQLNTVLPSVTKSDNADSDEHVIYSLHLPSTRTEPTIPYPFYWVTTACSADLATSELPLLNTSGAWYLTRLAGVGGKPVCLGDALRLGLINVHTRTCCQSNEPNYTLKWEEAANQGWITHQAVRYLTSSLEFESSVQTSRRTSLPMVQLLENSSDPTKPNLNPVDGTISLPKQTLSDAHAAGRLSIDAFEAAAGFIASGVCVAMEGAEISWTTSSSTTAPAMATMRTDRPPCLTDWLNAGAFNPRSRRLRVLTVHSSFSETHPRFEEIEMTLQEAVRNGILDANRREFIVTQTTPKKNGNALMRLTLKEAASRGLLDTKHATFRVLGSRKAKKLPVEVTYASGYLARPLTVVELLLAGRWFSNGILDLETGEKLSLPVAISKGIVDDRDDCLIVPTSKIRKPLSLHEALESGILTSSGCVRSDRGQSVPLRQAVNSGLVRLLDTVTYPPIPGPSFSETHPRFEEIEMTLQEAVRNGILDANRREFIVTQTTPKKNGNALMRLTLKEAASRGLLDTKHATFRVLGSRKAKKLPVEVTYASGYLARPLTVVELLLAGRWFSNGILDLETGEKLSLPVAISKGIVDDRDDCLIVPTSKIRKPLSLHEALESGILTSSGCVRSDRGQSVPLRQAVNSGLVRLLDTVTYPPIPGPVITKTGTLIRHPILEAMVSHTIDATTCEVVSARGERFRLADMACVTNANVDAQTADLLTSPCGLFGKDGNELSGLQALANEILQPASPSALLGIVTEALTGRLLKTRAEIGKHLSPKGARLLLGLSPFRPAFGFIKTRKVITRLDWIGPGIEDQKTTTSRTVIPVNESINQCLRKTEDVPISSLPMPRRRVEEEVNLPPPVDPQTLRENHQPNETRALSIAAVQHPHIELWSDPSESRCQDTSNPETCDLQSPVPSNEALRKCLLSSQEVPSRGSRKRSANSVWKPITLNEAITMGRIVEDSQRSCLLSFVDGTGLPPMGLVDAITSGRLDAKRSRMKDPSTGRWMSLEEAVRLNLMDLTTGRVKCEGQWISLADAVLQGLFPDAVPSAEDCVTLEEAIERGLVDLAKNTARNPMDGTVTSVDVALCSGWLEEPEKDMRIQLLQPVDTESIIPAKSSRIDYPSAQLESAKPNIPWAAGVQERKPTSRLIPGGGCCASVQQGGDDMFLTGGSMQRRRLPLSPRQAAAGRSSASSTEPLRGGSQTLSRQTWSLKRKIRRNCVVSGFYVTHQSLRVETAITQAMVREGRFDIRRGLVYDADSSAMITVGEALSNGLIVATVFTTAEVEQTLKSDHEASAEMRDSKTYWLEIFGRRHDTYLIERIYDAHSKQLISIGEALDTGLLDPVHGLYKQKNGETMTLEDALQQGLIQAVHQLRPPSSDLAMIKFDTIHVRTVEEDMPMRSVTVLEPLSSGGRAVTTTVRAGAAPLDYDGSLNLKSQLTGADLQPVAPAEKHVSSIDIHLVGHLSPVPLDDGAAISVIKLPLVRRLPAMALPTLEGPRKSKSSTGPRLDLSTALRRGWIDPQGGRLRTATGATAQLDLFEAAEQGFLDASSLLMKICTPNASDSEVLVTAEGMRNFYSLATVLAAARIIARADKNMPPPVVWRHRLLSGLIAANRSDLVGLEDSNSVKILASLTPADRNHIQHLMKTGPCRLDSRSVAEKEKAEKETKSNEIQTLPVASKTSLLRAIRMGQVDTGKCTFTYSNMGYSIPIIEAIERGFIDTKTSLLKVPKTDRYVSLKRFFITDRHREPLEVWMQWPMATLVRRREEASFAYQLLHRGGSISFTGAQALSLVDSHTRSVLNPKTGTKVPLLEAFTQGPLCSSRTVCVDLDSGEFVSAKQYLSPSTKPLSLEFFVEEIWKNKSRSIELSEDIFISQSPSTGGEHFTSELSVNVPMPVTFGTPTRAEGSGHKSSFETFNFPVDLKTAIRLSWIDESTGFVNDPLTGDRLLLKEAVDRGIIDAENVLFVDPSTRQSVNLASLFSHKEPINFSKLIAAIDSGEHVLPPLTRKRSLESSGLPMARPVFSLMSPEHLVKSMDVIQDTKTAGNIGLPNQSTEWDSGRHTQSHGSWTSMNKTEADDGLGRSQSSTVTSGQDTGQSYFSSPIHSPTTDQVGLEGNYLSKNAETSASQITPLLEVLQPFEHQALPSEAQADLTNVASCNFKPVQSLEIRANEVSPVGDNRNRTLGALEHIGRALAATAALPVLAGAAVVEALKSGLDQQKCNPTAESSQSAILDGRVDSKTAFILPANPEEVETSGKNLNEDDGCIEDPTVSFASANMPNAPDNAPICVKDRGIGGWEMPANYVCPSEIDLLENSPGKNPPGSLAWNNADIVSLVTDNDHQKTESKDRIQTNCSVNGKDEISPAPLLSKTNETSRESSEEIYPKTAFCAQPQENALLTEPDDQIIAKRQESSSTMLIERIESTIKHVTTDDRKYSPQSQALIIEKIDGEAVPSTEDVETGDDSNRKICSKYEISGEQEQESASSLRLDSDASNFPDSTEASHLIPKIETSVKHPPVKSTAPSNDSVIAFFSASIAGGLELQADRQKVIKSSPPPDMSNGSFTMSPASQPHERLTMDAECLRDSDDVYRKAHRDRLSEEKPKEASSHTFGVPEHEKSAMTKKESDQYNFVPGTNSTTRFIDETPNREMEAMAEEESSRLKSQESLFDADYTDALMNVRSARIESVPTPDGSQPEIPSDYDLNHVGNEQLLDEVEDALRQEKPMPSKIKESIPSSLKREGRQPSVSLPVAQCSKAEEEASNEVARETTTETEELPKSMTDKLGAIDSVLHTITGEPVSAGFLDNEAIRNRSKSTQRSESMSPTANKDNVEHEQTSKASKGADDNLSKKGSKEEIPGFQNEANLKNPTDEQEQMPKDEQSQISRCHITRGLSGVPDSNDVSGQQKTPTASHLSQDISLNIPEEKHPSLASEHIDLVEPPANADDTSHIETTLKALEGQRTTEGVHPDSAAPPEDSDKMQSTVTDAKDVTAGKIGSAFEARWTTDVEEDGTLMSESQSKFPEEKPVLQEGELLPKETALTEGPDHLSINQSGETFIQTPLAVEHEKAAKEERDNSPQVAYDNLRRKGSTEEILGTKNLSFPKLPVQELDIIRADGEEQHGGLPDSTDVSGHQTSPTASHLSQDISLNI
ncbi:unnamed protein product, partial [Schistocephalus solidus]|uniref:Calponin-homology (CH) domain-containing protein n=1 Tax=Schistocephalus solidus TaxID=70667 RepID=A0A183STH5_SCHSO